MPEGVCWQCRCPLDIGVLPRVTTERYTDVREEDIADDGCQLSAPSSILAGERLAPWFQRSQKAQSEAVQSREQLPPCHQQPRVQRSPPQCQPLWRSQHAALRSLQAEGSCSQLASSPEFPGAGVILQMLRPRFRHHLQHAALTDSERARLCITSITSDSSARWSVTSAYILSLTWGPRQHEQSQADV